VSVPRSECGSIPARSRGLAQPHSRHLPLLRGPSTTPLAREMCKNAHRSRPRPSTKPTASATSAGSQPRSIGNGPMPLSPACTSSTSPPAAHSAGQPAPPSRRSRSAKSGSAATLTWPGLVARSPSPSSPKQVVGGPEGVGWSNTTPMPLTAAPWPPAGALRTHRPSASRSQLRNGRSMLTRRAFGKRKHGPRPALARAHTTARRRCVTGSRQAARRTPHRADRMCPPRICSTPSRPARSYLGSSANNGARRPCRTAANRARSRRDHGVRRTVAHGPGQRGDRHSGATPIQAAGQ